MAPILISLGTILGLGAFGALVGYRNRVVPAGAVGITPAVLQARILAIFNTAKNSPAYVAALKSAAEAATALGLVKTAKGLRSDSGLPSDETWPGTNQSVQSFINEKRGVKK